MTTQEKPQLSPLLKLVLDLGPLVLFFLANSRPALFLPLVAPVIPPGIASGERVGIFVATAVFMVAIVVALVISYALTRHLPVMPVVTAVLVLVFGSLTLFLQDEHFIKIKPTIIYVLFGVVLAGGLAFGKSLLGMVFDSVFHLTPRRLAQAHVALGAVLLRLAVLNEIVWRTQSTDLLGELQGVRRHAAHLRVRRPAVSVADEIRGAGNQERIASRKRASLGFHLFATRQFHSPLAIRPLAPPAPSPAPASGPSPGFLG